MKKVLKVATALAVIFASPSFAQNECEANITVKGNMMFGKTFDSFAVFPNTKEATAFKMAYASLVKNGYQITSSNGDVGSVIASQPVPTLNGDKAIQFSVFIESDGASGSKVTYSIQTPAGFIVSDAEGKKQVCLVNSTVGNK